jgi:response regulator RpfG family c-di-GMP phosphodiesterase
MTVKGYVVYSLVMLKVASRKRFQTLRKVAAMQCRRKRLLVVDDEPDILEFLKVILEEEGYAVVTSLKGEYLEHLHNGGLPDLILLDVLLSGKDGRLIVKYLKS